jgi:formylglycine-generating enzyme required for sulfatase activity
MRITHSLLMLALTSAVSVHAQSTIIIESLDSAGSMTFNRTSNAVSYRVEWAPTVDGPWTNFATASDALDLIPGEGTGPITAAVPMVYRVVATVTNPPAPDYSIVNSGASSYTINGQSNPILELTRGQSYTLEVKSSGHPFWIKTAPVTGTGSAYTNGLSTNGITSGLITFAVPMDAPDTLYYICQFHGAMQGVINIVGGAPPAPAGMALIPAGEFVMGDSFGGEGWAEAELPLHTNYISAFYMDQYEVTKALWDEVKAFNGGNGYTYSNTGQGKATNHPVHTVNWFDVVKWCNARSQRDGLTPVYYTDAGFTTVYKTGEIAPIANWSANGYRLPTEAEWEKAARGGVAGQRFPWGNTITHNNANYFSSSSYAYDTSSTRGDHPTFATGSTPYTSPVGYFAPNGYGLYDMAGNVWEWCWDWYGSSYYSSSPSTDPRGPSSGLSRVLRGGSWGDSADGTRVANRAFSNPVNVNSDRGFRCARGL